MQAKPATPSTPAADALIDAVLEASRALVAVSARSIAAERSVTLPQFRMLVVLQRGQISLSGLARALDVAPSTALRMVDRLIAVGLVTRSTAAHDRRESRLELTRDGDRTVRRVSGRRRRDLQRILDRVPVSRRSGLQAGMTAFAAASEPVLGGHPADN